MAYDESLTQRIRELVKGTPELIERKMFGGIAFMVQGNLACGVNKDSMIARIGKDAYDEALLQPYVRPFDITGRPMAGWIMVGSEGCVSEQALAEWVEKGVAFALSLPAK